MEAEKEIIVTMKKKLQGLSAYMAALRLRSVLYDETERVLEVQDDLSDYLQYTKSILSCRHHAHTYKEEPVLAAMQRREARKERLQKEEQEALLLLHGIDQLPPQEQSLLFDLYVRRYDRRVVMHRQGDIVESTLHRRLHRALLHLWEMLACLDI